MSRRRTFPGYERIAEYIETALDSSCIELTITHDGHPAELYNLARCLDKAGLIDWAAFPRAVAQHSPDCIYTGQAEKCDGTCAGPRATEQTGDRP